MPQDIDYDYSPFTNLSKNWTNAHRHDEQHVLTNFEGKVLDFDARDAPITNRIINDAWLIDANKYNMAADAMRDGDEERYARLMDAARSPLYKDLLVEANRQQRRLDRAGYIPPSQVLIGRTAAAAGGEDGQLLTTAQEIVRQTKYQTKVSGVFYRTEKFQAVNVVNKISTGDLTTTGATDVVLPQGHPEIGDDQTPVAVKPEFNVFEKQIFADSFHYGFGMREKSDAWFNIVDRLTSKVAGAMLRMKNEKITAVLNAKTASTSGTKWDVYMASSSTGAHDIVSQDAALTVEDSINALEDYEGDIVHIMPRQVQRWYNRNTQGRNVTSVKSTQNKRSGTLEWNEGTYYIENTVTPKVLFSIAKDVWMDHYIGPEIDVAYKDRMKPSNYEGRILFHFNGIKEKIDKAIEVKQVLT